MSGFRALFIGIKEYQNNSIKDFPKVIENDFNRLSDSLQDIGFTEPDIISSDNSDFITRSDYKSIIKQFFSRSHEQDTLLIYISGHGLHIDNKDYLILPRAKPELGQDILDDCLQLDFSELLRNSSAKTAIVMIDTCREAIDFGVKSIKVSKWSNSKVQKVGQQKYVTLYACSAGEDAHYQTEEDDGGYSFFTYSFCSALKAQKYQLKDAIDHTNTQLSLLVKKFGRKNQQITFASEMNNTEFNITIGNAPSSVEQQSEIILWQNAINKSDLWSFFNTEKKEDTDALKLAVNEIVIACWQQYQQTKTNLTDNPWFDENLPIRVLQRNSLILHRIQTNFKPTQAELLLLFVSPFVREALVAQELLNFTNVDLKKLQDDASITDNYTSRFQQMLKANEALARKCQSLLDRGKYDDFYAVAFWLIHKAVRRNPQLWQIADSSPLTSAFNSISKNFSHIQETLAPERVIEFARIIFSDPERIEMTDRASAFQNSVHCDGFSDNHIVKEKSLAYLALFSGRLAIDCTQLPDLLVDHIGLNEVLTAKQILQTCNQIKWNPHGQVLDLRLTCPHQAIDMALLEHIQETNSVLDTLLNKTKINSQLKDSLHTMPLRLTSDDLKAEQRNGELAYQKPHIHFHLAQQQVQQLLMGTQLYGDASLAIRELYQNALDACRYRQARLQYIKATHSNSDLLNQWQAQITFIQNRDDQGRAYVECKDTGIGMGIRELSGCFAQAGRRFHDTPEFLEEQASWREHDIELYPNSQFGVGVFSYFMLADEIEITTTRMDKQGKLSHTIEARVSSAGSLFRVVEKPHQGTAGTCIKLILKPNIAENLSTFKTLTSLLWIAEFPTEVLEADTTEEDQEIPYNKKGKDKANRKQKEKINEFNWRPQQLYVPSNEEARVVKTANKNFWWYKRVNQSGYTDADPYYSSKVLCDGLVTEFHGNNIYGTLINLTAKHYPKLTVDRKTCLNDIDKSHWNQIAIEQITPLIDAKFIDYDYLLRMRKHNGRCNVISAITLALFEAKATIPIALKDNSSNYRRFNYSHIVDIDFSYYGLWEDDYELLQSLRAINKERKKDHTQILRELKDIEDGYIEDGYIEDSYIETRHFRFIQWNELVSSQLNQPSSIEKKFPNAYQAISNHYLSQAPCLPTYEWMKSIIPCQLSLKKLLAISEYNDFSIQKNIRLINRDAKLLYQTPNIDCTDELYGTSLNTLVLDNHDQVTLQGLVLAAVKNETSISQVLEHCQTLFKTQLLSFNQTIEKALFHYQFDKQDKNLIENMFLYSWVYKLDNIETVESCLNAKLAFNYTELKDYLALTKEIDELKTRLQRFLDIGLKLDFELDELDSLN